MENYDADDDYRVEEANVKFKVSHRLGRLYSTLAKMVDIFVRGICLMAFPRVQSST